MAENRSEDVVEPPGSAEILDLTGVRCPDNTTRAAMKLLWMDPGEKLELIVDDGDPIDNLPASLEFEGHSVLTVTRMGNRWKVVVERGDV